MLHISLNSCRQPVEKKVYRHLSDSLFLSYSELVLKTDEQIFTRKLDSLISTFPYISTADRYYYMYLRRTNFYRDLDNKDQQEAIMIYTDSMINLIKAAGLETPLRKEYQLALQHKSEILIRQKRYAEAVDLISKCKYQNITEKDTTGLADNINTIAYISYYQRKLPDAINYYKEALSLFQHTGPPNLRYYKIQRVLNDIGVMYRGYGKPDSALYYHFATEKYLNENYKLLLPQDSLFRYLALVNVYDNIAYTYLDTKEFDKTEVYIKKAIDLSVNNLKSISTKTEQADLYQTLAAALFGKGNLDSAASMNNIAYQSYAGLDPYSRLSLLELQVKIDSARRDVSNRVENLLHYIRLNDSMNANTIQALKKSPEVVYEALVKKNELALKNKSIRLQKVRRLAIYIIGGLFAVLALTLFFYLHRIRQVMGKLKKTMLEAELQQKQKEEEQLRFQEIRLQAKYQDDIARQRQDISNDLHDSLSGSLVALRYLIEDIRKKYSKDSIRNALSDIGAEVGSIYAATREYML